MRRARRILVVGIVMALATTMLGACAEEDNNEEIVRDAIRKTERMAKRFTYTDEASGQIISVQGVVEDDFRHAERMSINDQPAMDQVVSDDNLALRFLSPDLVPRFVGTRGGNTDVPGGPKGVPVIDVLGTRRWVLDKAGAPSLIGRKVRANGADPIFDALTTLRYVNQAIDEAAFVRVFNAEALDYKPKEDPFPHPKGAVKRYDLQRPPLPRDSAGGGGGGGGGGNQAVPDTLHFRRMAVYIEDGLVREVREVIDVATRLRELSRVYGVKFPDRPPNELAVVALDAINALRTGQGDDPIRMRAMTIRYTDLGAPQKVDLPTDAVPGTIDLRSKELDESDARAGANTETSGGTADEGGGASETSTTTTPGG